MAHKDQLAFIEAIQISFPSYFNKKRVLDVGSAGTTTVRSMFSGCQYTGIDLAPAEGVDVVCSGHEFEAPTGSFGFVFSCESFEHNPYWLETFINMLRVCSNGGIIVMTCASTARGEHGTMRSAPKSSLSTTVGWNYYKNLTARDFHSRIDLAAHFSYHKFFNNFFSQDLYFLGIKKGTPDQNLQPPTPKELLSFEERVKLILSPNSHTQKECRTAYLKRLIRNFCGSETAYQNLLHFFRTKLFK